MRPSTELLTESELDAIDRAGELWNVLRRIVADGPSRARDLTELATHIHAIQHAVLAQAGGRAYPDRFRLLGGPLPIDIGPGPYVATMTRAQTIAAGDQ